MPKKLQITNFGLKGCLRYDIPQNLTAEEQAQARENMGANELMTSTDAVKILAESGIIQPVAASDSVIYSENNVIFIY